jgi:hypothetical protein
LSPLDRAQSRTAGLKVALKKGEKERGERRGEEGGRGKRSAGTGIKE